MMKHKSVMLSLAVTWAILISLMIGCSQEKKVQSLLSDAKRYADEGRLEAAEINFRNVLREDDSNPEAIAGLANLFYEQGLWANAIQTLARASLDFPEDSEIQNKYATVLLVANQWQKAAELSRNILAKDPDSARAALNLANATRSEELLPSTIDQLENARVSAPDNPGIATGLALIAIKKNEWESARNIIEAVIEKHPEYYEAYTVKAAIHILVNEVPETRSALKKAADLAPRNSPQTFGYAQFLYQTNQVEEAITYLESKTLDTHDYIPNLTLLATAYSHAQKFEKAKKVFVRVLRREPGNLGVLLAKSKVAIAEKDLDTAEQILDAIISQNPSLAEAQLYRGLVSVARLELDEAALRIDKSLRLDPNNLKATLALAQVYARTGKHREAILLLEDQQERFSDNPALQLILANSYQAYGDAEKALGIYEKLSNSNPDRAEFPYLVGLSQLSLGNLDIARENFERSLKLDPKQINSLSQIVALDIQDDRFADALNRIDEHIAQYPEASALRVLRGKLNLYQNDVDEAEKDFEKAIELKADNREPYFQLARIYHKQDRHNQALKRLASILEQNPLDIGALMLSAEISEQRGDIPQAIVYYEKILEANADFAPALNNLAYRYSENPEQLDQAFELAQRARQQLPDSPYASDTLGWIAYKRKDFSWAASLLKESLRKLPENPEVKYHLGMAYTMLGKEIEARRLFEQSLSTAIEYVGRDICETQLALLNIVPGEATAEQIAILEEQAAVGNPTALMRLASRAEQDGDHAQAKRLVESILEHVPDNAFAHSRLATLALNQGKLEAAYSYAKDAYKLEPNSAKIATALGVIALASGDFSRAHSLLSDSVRAEPGNPELAINLVQSLFASGNEKLALETAARSSPSNGLEALSSFIENYHETGSAGIAGALLRALDRTPANASLIGFAESIALADGSVQIDSLKSFSQSWSDFAPAKRLLAIRLADDPANDEETRKHTIAAQKSYVDDSNLLHIRALLAYRAGDSSEANDLLERCLRIEPGHEKAQDLRRELEASSPAN